MKSIGILTFQNANNYGAVFQTYALQEVLKELGADVKVINYDSPAMRLKNMQERRFFNFINEYLQLTEETSDSKDINTACFDGIITGSDQVWNPEINGFDDTYFLDFLNDDTKKISYAASIGLNMDLIGKYENVYRKYLPKYDAISVREEMHVDYVKNIVGNNKNVIASVDPSLLLTEKEYTYKLGLNKKDLGEYIFVFSYSEDPKLVDFANMLSLHTGYKIIAISRYSKNFFTKGSLIVNDNTPIEWMEYVKNAKMILTDSFHGVMYSMVFNKPFYAYTPLRSNVIRIIEVLNRFGFENRRLTCVKNIYDVDFELDYKYANIILENERKRAYEYLKNSINWKNV